jgi:hypothetical protein
MHEMTKPPNVRKSRPVPTVRVRPELCPEDLAWEQDLVLMLSRLDSLRARLAAELAREDLAQAVAHMGELLVPPCDLDASHPVPQSHPETVAALQQQARQVQEAGEELQAHLRPSALGMLKRLFSRPASPVDLSRLFERFFQEVVAALEAHFTFFTACFHAPSGAHGWIETSDVFLKELKSLIVPEEGGS